MTAPALTPEFLNHWVDQWTTYDFNANPTAARWLRDCAKRIEQLEAENTRLRKIEEAARVLLELKAGPRDTPYYEAKGPAWADLAAALSVDTTGEQQETGSDG